jgi:hypothetical protein
VHAESIGLSSRAAHDPYAVPDRGLAEEIQLAIAPLFVGDAAALPFVGLGIFPDDSAHRMTLAAGLSALYIHLGP